MGELVDPLASNSSAERRPGSSPGSGTTDHMNAPITYTPLLGGLLHDKGQATEAFDQLDREVQWIQRDRTPRMECFYSAWPDAYTYGSGLGIRSYDPLPIPEFGIIPALWFVAEGLSRCRFEACFLNRYEHEREHLGWHADDSDVIDDTRPIAVLSFGAERELWFRENGSSEFEKKLLENGSALIMLAGMQDTHQHRIPKHHAKCGPRISLTFRGLVKAP